MSHDNDDAAEHAKAMLHGGETATGAETPGLDDVRFHLEVGGIEANWQVRLVNLHEGLNQLSHLVVDALCPDGHPQVSELLDKDCHLVITRTSQQRSHHGVVWHATVQDEMGVPWVQLQVAPALRYLTEIIGSRIFQDRTVPEIVEDVFRTRLGERKRSLRNDLRGEYAKREYTVQYDESEYDFIARLLEEEGVFTYFDHAGDNETLVLADDTADLLHVRQGDAKVPFARDAYQMPDHEAVTHVSHEDYVGASDVVVNDYDWSNPALDVRAEQTGRAHREPALEIYDHDNPVTFHRYDGRQYGFHTAKKQAKMRAERLDLSRQRWNLTTTVTTAQPGYILQVAGAPDPNLDRRYLITHAESWSEATKGGAGNWVSTLHCVPVDLPYRPPRATRRPSVAGMESATVVGPSGEDIHTDAHGRVKVQFHWDRQGRRDERSSCWLRAMQAWAGPGYGTMFLPRVGMEVAVAFMGGDPDRPFVVGCLYNGKNAVPANLDGDKTQSVLRTKSSPNSDGYNELRFEDKAGQERVHIHAEKDFDEVVEHDHTTRVKNDQTNTVDVNQSETIGKNQTLRVKNDRKKTVDNDEVNLIEANRTTNVKLEEKLTVEKGARTVSVQTGKDTEEYLGGRETTVTPSDMLTVAEDKKTMVGQHVEIDVGGHYKLVQASSNELLIDDKVRAETIGNIELDSGSGASLAELTPGGKIRISADAEITIEVGSSKITVSTSGVKIEAPTFRVNGQSLAEIQAPLIKLN